MPTDPQPAQELEQPTPEEPTPAFALSARTDPELQYLLDLSTDLEEERVAKQSPRTYSHGLNPVELFSPTTPSLEPTPQPPPLPPFPPVSPHCDLWVMKGSALDTGATVVISPFLSLFSTTTTITGRAMAGATPQTRLSFIYMYLHSLEPLPASIGLLRLNLPPRSAMPIHQPDCIDL